MPGPKIPARTNGTITHEPEAPEAAKGVIWFPKTPEPSMAEGQRAPAAAQGGTRVKQYGKPGAPPSADLQPTPPPAVEPQPAPASPSPWVVGYAREVNPAHAAALKQVFQDVSPDMETRLNALAKDLGAKVVWASARRVGIPSQTPAFGESLGRYSREGFVREAFLMPPKHP